MARTVTLPGRTAVGGGAASNPSPSGLQQGTLGGMSRRRGFGGGMAMGDELYLWILVFAEVAAMGMLRQQFRRYHGG